MSEEVRQDLRVALAAVTAANEYVNGRMGKAEFMLTLNGLMGDVGGAGDLLHALSFVAVQLAATVGQAWGVDVETVLERVGVGMAQPGEDG